MAALPALFVIFALPPDLFGEEKTIAVAFTTVDPPKWGKCGKFDWNVRFFITDQSGQNPQPLKRDSQSWIIQHIKKEFHVKDCPAGAEQSGEEDQCKGTDKNLPTEDYYEAWRVGKSGAPLKAYEYDFDGKGALMVDKSDKNADDYWWQPAREGTCGSWKFDGWASWQESIRVGELDPGGVREAGDLPSSRSAPAGLGPWTLHRHVETEWNCCHGSTYSGKATCENKWNTYTETWDSKGAHTKTVDGKEVAQLAPGQRPREAVSLGKAALIIRGSPVWDAASFDPAAFIYTVNSLLPLGKEEVLRGLEEYRAALPAAADEVLEVSRLRLLLAVLFEPDDPAKPVPRLRIGTSDDVREPPQSTWPFYPLAVVHDIPLLVTPVFSLVGSYENPERLIEFCRKYGHIRRRGLSPTGNPTQIVDELMHSPLWYRPAQEADADRASLRLQVLKLARGACHTPGIEGLSALELQGGSAEWDRCAALMRSGHPYWNPATNTFGLR